MPSEHMPESDGHNASRSRPVSRTWLFAALGVTAVCAVLLAAQFIGLLRYPFHEREVTPAAIVDADNSLVVAVARTPGGPGEWANWAQVIKSLSDELGRPVTVRYLSKEDEAAEVIVEQNVDLAFVCAHHYVDLSESGECVGLVTPVIDGSTTTHAMILVRADDPANSMKDLKDAVFAVSDKSSLGGYAYASYLTKRLGSPPEGYFSEVRMGETQEQNMHDVLDGTARATVASSVQVISWDMSQFKVLDVSDPIGCPPVVVDSEMEPALRKQITDILTAMDTRALLPEASAIDGFEPLDPAEYEFAAELRAACGHHGHK